MDLNCPILPHAIWNWCVTSSWMVNHCLLALQGYQSITYLVFCWIGQWTSYEALFQRFMVVAISRCSCNGKISAEKRNWGAECSLGPPITKHKKMSVAEGFTSGVYLYRDGADHRLLTVCTLLIMHCTLAVLIILMILQCTDSTLYSIVCTLLMSLKLTWLTLVSANMFSVSFSVGFKDSCESTGTWNNRNQKVQ